MATPTLEQIGKETLEILKQVSNRPIEPTMQSEVIADLGFDSILVLELISELEERFDISIPLNNLAQIKTVGQMVEHIKTLCDKQAEV